jgi:hypothetical protein
MAGIAAAAAQHKNSERFLGELVTGNQLHRFADLVANQPQLYVSLERRLGSELTGPQRTSVDLTWERGLVSLGNFYKDAPDGCKQDQLVATTVAPPTGDPPPWAPATCLTAFKNFVMENEDAINSAGRSAFSLRYSKIERYAFSRPLSGLNVTVPSTEKLAASFTFGRKFVAAERRAIVGDDSRVDFIVKYEHSDDETVLNSRTIAGFTFSRKLGDNIVPVTLLYADKGEMAGDSGSQITVNFGMAFQLIQ